MQGTEVDWFRERKQRALHQKVEQLCAEACARRGRTWLRMLIDARRIVLEQVLAQLSTKERMEWRARYGLGDIMPGAAAAARRSQLAALAMHGSEHDEH